MKTYLVSEELLRQVLDALIPHKSVALRWYTKEDEAIDRLRTLLAKEPNEPAAWALTMPDGVRLLHKSEEASRHAEDRWFDSYEGCEHIPLYRKDL